MKTISIMVNKPYFKNKIIFIFYCIAIFIFIGVTTIKAEEVKKNNLTSITSVQKFDPLRKHSKEVIFLKNDNQQNYNHLRNLIKKNYSPDIQIILEPNIKQAFFLKSNHNYLPKKTRVVFQKIDSQNLFFKISGFDNSTLLRFLETYHPSWNFTLLPWKIGAEQEALLLSQNLTNKVLSKLPNNFSAPKLQCKKFDKCDVSNPVNWAYDHVNNMSLLWPRELHWQTSKKFNTWWISKDLILSFDRNKKFVKQNEDGSISFYALINFNLQKSLEVGILLSQIGFLIAVIIFVIPKARFISFVQIIFNLLRIVKNKVT